MCCDKKIKIYNENNRILTIILTAVPSSCASNWRTVDNNTDYNT